jgi:hypothetical protein
VQAGSLLSPQVQPLAWAALAGAAWGLRRPSTALLWGAACGLLLFDYEGWALGLPGLVALLLTAPAEGLSTRRKALWAALGLGLGTAVVLASSAGIWPAYAAQRQAYSAPGSQALANLGRHLIDFFVGGGQALPTQGVALGAAQFPVWALAPLLLGAALAWRRPVGDRPAVGRALLLAAAAPLAAFALHAPGIPSQRVLTAWPALCLLAGIGLADAWRWRAWSPWALGALLLVGGAWEARQAQHGWAALGGRFYGQGSAWLQAGPQWRQSPPVELLWQLDARDRGDLALTCGAGLAAPGQGPVMAVIPWQCAPALPAGGHLEALEPGEGQAPVLVYWAPASAVPELREAQAALQAYWAAHVDGASLPDLVAATAKPIANPWVRDALWEARFLAARRLNRPELDEGDQARALGLLRVDPWLRQARDLRGRDPKKSEALLREALKRDPRRREAWRALGALLASQGRQKDLKIMNKSVLGLGIHSYEPAWLVE